MYTNPDEAAYCMTRIAHSRALAAASADSCARASHVGIAQAYGDRLTSLIQTRRGIPEPIVSTVDA